MLLRALRNVRDGLVGLTYPQECRVCGNPVDSWDDGVACAGCWGDASITRHLSGNLCAKCGSRGSLVTGSPESRSCAMCEALPFSAARACGVYAGALEASILFLKVNPHICPRLRSIIGRTFVEHRSILDSDVVIPVPLHHLRRKQRGFNQAEIISRLLSRRFGLDGDEHSLVRSKPTERHRAGMDAADRARSVARAFEVVRPRLIQNSRVLLVDDVYTTGSTICAAASALLDAGARGVNVLTIARVAAH